MTSPTVLTRAQLADLLRVSIEAALSDLTVEMSDALSGS